MPQTATSDLHIVPLGGLRLGGRLALRGRIVSVGLIGACACAPSR